jgi:hypothetical protein
MHIESTQLSDFNQIIVQIVENIEARITKLQRFIDGNA